MSRSEATTPTSTPKLAYSGRRRAALLIQHTLVTCSSAPKLLARASLVLSACLIPLLAAEVALRAFWIGSNGYYVLKPHLALTIRPNPANVHGVGPQARFQVNSQGIRGTEWSSDRAQEYRILAIGGSTTECLYLDQEKTWAALLESQLGTAADARRLWVGNLGKGGLNTRDHVAVMRFAIDQYDADAIIVLAGANDLLLRLGQGNAFDPSFMQDEARYREWLSSRFAIVPLSHQSGGDAPFKRTALWRLAREANEASRRLRSQVPVQDEAGDWVWEWRDRRKSAPLVEELPPLGPALDEYERNLTEIVRQAQRRDIRVVLATQPSIWRATMTEDETRLLGLGWRPDGSYYTTAALAEGMDAYNRRTLAVCANLGVECVDAAARMPRTLEVFYDEMHYTEAGAKRFADELLDHLRVRAPFAPV